MIEACNVRPAFEASLAFGVGEDELAARAGLTRALLATGDAHVSADATYAHMELMFGKPRFAAFLVAAARSHTLASMGVVGLACKTAATIGEAMACHQRFGHLTNRTARYSSRVVGHRLVLAERRDGPARLGSLLISDYAMLIAAHILRQHAPGAVVHEMHSRRTEVGEDDRIAFAEILGDAAIRVGAEHAELHLDAAILTQSVPSSDRELADYFSRVLAQSAVETSPAEDPLLHRVRAAIRDALVRGPPPAADIARRLGLGQRTLQRRLLELGTTFAGELESTRRSLAAGYLRDASLSLAEVAYLLGYDEQPSFFRAFRRWYGTTPGAWRRGVG